MRLTKEELAIIFSDENTTLREVEIWRKLAIEHDFSVGVIFDDIKPAITEYLKTSPDVTQALDEYLDEAGLTRATITPAAIETLQDKFINVLLPEIKKQIADTVKLLRQHTDNQKVLKIINEKEKLEEEYDDQQLEAEIDDVEAMRVPGVADLVATTAQISISEAHRAATGFTPAFSSVTVLQGEHDYKITVQAPTYTASFASNPYMQTVTFVTTPLDTSSATPPPPAPSGPS